MAHAQESVVVPHPIDQVFAFVVDGLNEARWRPGVSKIRLLAGSKPAVGTVYAQKMIGPGGRQIDGDYRITVFEEPVRMDFEVIAGPARPVGSFTLVAEATDSTRLTFTLDLQPRGLLVFLKAAIEKQVATEARSILNVPAAMAGA